MTDLSTVRKQIDDLDQQIQSLLTQRANLASDVAKAKRKVETTPNFYRPEREAEVLRKVIARNQGPLSNEVLTGLFKNIMSACLALQKPLKVAYLGPEGTYSEAAALLHFGHSIEKIPVQTIREVFRSVSTGLAQYAVVPIENSTEGGVTQTLDMLLNSPLNICGETELAIHHCLLAQNPLDKIQRIYSHQQSLGQCRLWLEQHAPDIERIGVSSNAEAAKLAANDPHAAAIAGSNNADLYNLSCLAENIEDEPENTTRFAIIGEQQIPVTGQDKTSLVLSTQNHAGALHDLLGCFLQHDINLSRVESRPAQHSAWNYVFFIDLDGHIDDAKVKAALSQLVSHCTLFKHLGSYPQQLKLQQ